MLGGGVVVVSFGVKEGAQKWKEDTKCPFPMYLDTDRNLYRAFGLNRSLSKTWGIKAMVFYGEKVTQGVSLIKPYENIHDDVEQMGGNFILDTAGKMQLVYPSQHSSDRPTIDNILSVFRKLHI